MSITESKIKRRPASAGTVAGLAALGINPVLARLYAARGVLDVADLDTELAGLIPPSQLLNAGKAAAILAEAIQTGRRIVIAGDFDVDGAAAASVGLRGLRMMGAEYVDFALPHRVTRLRALPSPGAGYRPAVLP